MTIGKRLNSLRTSSGLSQATFGEKIGVAQSTIRNYENDVRAPDSEVLKSICVNFDVSADWLLFGKEPTACGSETAEIGGLTNQEKKQPTENIDMTKRKTADSSSFVPYADYHELECEVRGLYKDKVSLLEEVASLKERNRQLEEQVTQAVNALDANNAGMTKPKAVVKAG